MNTANICLAPVADRNATVLILGSLPGKRSLAVGQYYAHPRNLFWRILGELVGFDPTLPYEARVHRLQSAGIALWDVLESCVRKTSLDSDIETASEKPNNFADFFAEHPKMFRVFFNGTKAEGSYTRHVRLPFDERPIVYSRLPSTSPANTSMSYERKLAEWRVITKGDELKPAR
jgi:hypoxanthine-DNA glycosylase